MSKPNTSHDRWILAVEKLRNQRVDVQPHPTNPNLIVLVDESGEEVWVTTKGSTHVLTAVATVLEHDRPLQAALLRKRMHIDEGV